MSQAVINITQLENNWNAFVPNNPRTSGNSSIDVKQSDNTLYFGFDVRCIGKNQNRPCNAHLNLMHDRQTAHVTLVGWDGGRKTNYWYYINPNGTIVDAKAPPGMSSDIQGTSVPISKLPSEISTVIRNLIRDTYANCF